MQQLNFQSNAFIILFNYNILNQHLIATELVLKTKNKTEQKTKPNKNNKNTKSTKNKQKQSKTKQTKKKKKKKKKRTTT